MDIGVAKTNKYASRDSGDTVETVERPTGGISVVLVDGQGSGQAAKTLSMMVSSKAVALLKEGVRDGASARATHDFLHAYRHGKVSATLDIVSVDLASKSLVVTRNNPVPYLVRTGSSFEPREGNTTPIGLHRHTRPTVDQFELEPGLAVVVFSDGITNAGRRTGKVFDPATYLAEHLPVDADSATIANTLLDGALKIDDRRAGDDIAVAAISIVEHLESISIRTINVNVPFG